ncbi:MAG: hypothetical protein IT452_20285 [Planctomycetia bacterium]|nr:hypothetical protein [Planctomycetia bacterium]
MNPAWRFKEARPGDRARESQVEKFFNSDAVLDRADAIVREGIQNSLDAAPDGTPVTVRMRLGEWSSEQAAGRLPIYFKDFERHFEQVRDTFRAAQQPSGRFRFLAFEDFGTSGLRGNPSVWWPPEDGRPNPFFNFFRAEGLSGKGEGDRGRHGVGRLVFMYASSVRAMMGLTRTDKGSSLLMGTSVLRNHWYAGKPYLPDAWFGIASSTDQQLTMPIEDASFLDQFTSDFSLSRREEPGLSIVVPYLTDEVTNSALVAAVLNGYFYPILRGELSVEIAIGEGAPTAINSETIDSVLGAQPEQLQSRIRPLLTLAKRSLAIPNRIVLPQPQDNPKWAEQQFDDELAQTIRQKLEDSEVLALRVPMTLRPKQGPKAGQILPSQFEIFMERDTSAGEGGITFLREGIIISDARHTDGRPIRAPGVRALVVVEHRPIASFLGDCENPSHTQWQHSYVKDTYVLSRQHLEYVVGSLPAILRMISARQNKPDTRLLLDLFSIKLPGPTKRKTDRVRDKEKGDLPEIPEILVPPTIRRYSIMRSADGFSLRRGDADARRPAQIEIEAAYGVRRGSPFSKYNKADFVLGKGTVKYSMSGCKERERGDNWIMIETLTDDFEVDCVGFDTNRDLHVKVTVQDQEAANA